MGLQQMIINKVLQVVDKTIGKKFKIVDKITDQFQGLDAVVDELKQENKEIRAKITQLEERINENNNTT
jgi:peptidoglycan hydrolase CwlO-like protein